MIDPEVRAEIGDPVPITFAATVVYLPLLAVGILTSILWTGSLPGAAGTVKGALTQAGLGGIVALALVAVTYVLARTLKPFELLEKEFRTILGRLSRRETAWIAVLSGAAEEMLFRGTLQPWLASHWGPTAALVTTSVVFGALHYVPDRVFLPWTLFATVVGFLCGGLFMASGSVIAPVVTHTLLNAINLELIVTSTRRAG